MHRLSLAKMIYHRDKIIEKGFDMDFLMRIEIKRRLTKSTQIRASDPVKTREIRNPGTPENFGSSIAMLQDEPGGLPPRVGVVVNAHMQRWASRSGDHGHGCFPDP
jgi:hypothetical protein